MTTFNDQDVDRRRFPIGPPSAAHVLMVLSGALAFVLVLLVLRDRGATAVVVVAARDIEAHSPVVADALAEAVLPAAVAELNGLLDADSLATGPRREFSRDVPAGAPLLATDVVAADVASARLMSFAIDAARAGDGGIRAGDTIDVLAVTDGTAIVVAQNIAVRRLVNGDGVGRSAVTITLEVGEGQDLAIAAAVSRGDLYLVRTSDG